MFFNTKTAKTFALATAAALLTATAAQAEPVSFSRNGIDYTYSVSVEKGRQVITGTADRAPFRLVVTGDRVSGDFNYRPITFSLRDVKPNTEVAMR